MRQAYTLTGEARRRMEQYGVTVRDIEAALTRGRAYFDRELRNQNFVLNRYFPNGDSIQIARDPESGNVPTVIVQRHPFRLAENRFERITNPFSRRGRKRRETR